MALYRAHVIVSIDSFSILKGAIEVKDTLIDKLKKYKLDQEVKVLEMSTLGQIKDVPVILIYPEKVVYAPVKVEDIDEIVEEHLLKGRLVKRLIKELPWLPKKPKLEEARIVLSNAGLIDPELIEEYIANDGYVALGKVVKEMKPDEVLEVIKNSNLLGRGGAAFPTGLKWKFTRKAKGEPKYIIANADESEPGTFKDRLILEGDPHRIIEAMVIAGYAVGSHIGYIYIRGEYALVIERIKNAINQAHNMGFIGENIFGSDFNFEIKIHKGAGAYVCGEETALIESIEGKRGEPRFRPPYPPTYGLWGKPTVVNNVETFANVPPIIRNGADWFKRFGTERCPGTKVYTILGNIKNKGLIEVPMGISLRDVINIYGDGIPGDKKFKLAQTGGTSGSIIPESMLDVPMDYASMMEAGAALGSGALLICDETNCIVDLLKPLTHFFNYESCGKCVPCRVGTTKIYKIIERISRGGGLNTDISMLEDISKTMAATSLCGLGQAAAVPVLSAIKHFRGEIETHIFDKICPLGVCKI
ncbi:NADP-reducing hydrogenase subunit HndC [subsurface metagenome]